MLKESYLFQKKDTLNLLQSFWIILLQFLNLIKSISNQTEKELWEANVFLTEDKCTIYGWRYPAWILHVHYAEV